MKKFILFLAALAVINALPAYSAQEETTQLVYGAGPSTKIVELFFAEFAHTPACGDYTFEVPPKSVKHAGGIKSCETYVFGRTGRPLNNEEKNMNKAEIFLGQVPIAIGVGSETGISSLEMAQLEKIITGEYTNWQEVGGTDAPISNVGREEKEALFSILKTKYPFYQSAKFSQVFKKDDEVVAFLQNPLGKYGIGFGARPNFENKEGITILSIPGFSVGQQLGLVYDLSNQFKPIVKAVSEYANSQEWSAVAVANGYLPPNE